MKLSIAVALAAAGSLVAADAHHGHGHRHAKRNVVTTIVPGATETRYVLDGTPIPEKEACERVKNGDLLWADGEAPAGACQPKPKPTTTLPVKAGVFAEQSSSTQEQPKPTKSASSSSSGVKGLTAPFPDGEISCDEFPSDYGAVPLDHFGLGGWIGIQKLTMSGNSVSRIDTGIKGDKCGSGPNQVCSYACPPGYGKCQWPEYQGANGESVGGLACKNGKLYKTNSACDTLCVKGIRALTVKNTLSEVVSVCQTDYPGTESENVPNELAPGDVKELFNPDAATYYKWKGSDTSAQFYINPPGYDAETACQWGDSSHDYGNWAPMNLGLGYKNGATWASIFPNKPTTDKKLSFNVKFTGSISQECKYENGKYYSDSGVSEDGCTVMIPDGEEAQLIFY